MSSFLGAGQAGVGFVCLAAGVTVNLATTDAQALCTPTQKYRVTQLILKSGVTAGTSATAAFSLGYTAALSSFITATTYTSMPSTTTTTGTFIATPASGSTAQVPGYGAAGATVYFSMTTVSTGATSATVDVIGYLVP